MYERNAPHEANGFGVVFSARTMSRLRRSDPETHARIVRASVTVSDMELRHPRATLRYGGFDFSSISRQTLLTILQEQAASAGAVLHFGHHAAPGSLDDADVVVYADGANSAQRDARPERFGTTVRYGASPYMWLGTEAPFDAATFAFVATGHGHFAAHAYPYAEGLTTVVVETDPATWQASGMDRPADHARNPGGSDEASLERLSELFADHLGGHKLLGNRSRWATFRIVRNARWSDGNAVLLGDAAHTAHFTVGSGTKLAMEDAIALAAALDRDADPRAAFAAYERERRALVTRTQEWAEPSMRWWETFGRRLHMAPAQFGLHFMTRTSALTYEGLRRRFADRVDEAEEAYRTAGGTAARPWRARGAPAVRYASSASSTRSAKRRRSPSYVRAEVRVMKCRPNWAGAMCRRRPNVSHQRMLGSAHSWVRVTRARRSRSYAANAARGSASRSRAAASAIASSIASLVPEPTVKCAVWAASPRRTAFPSDQRALRTIRKVAHRLRLPSSLCPPRWSAKSSLSRSRDASSLPPGFRAWSAGRSMPEACQVAGSVSTTTVVRPSA
nr:FAD-dependent monooxygenase [Streptomyces hydrogenans]